MKRMKQMLRLLTVLLAPALLQSAGQQSGVPSLLPPAIASFPGTWNCKGSFRNGKPHESIYTTEVILAGKWLRLTEKDTLPATGYAAEYLIGYDGESKRLIEFDANTFGAATYTSADGWQAGTLTMTSSASTNPGEPYALNRFRYSFPSADIFEIDWQVSRTTRESWVSSDHLSCKRSACFFHFPSFSAWLKPYPYESYMPIQPSCPNLP